MSPAGTKRRLKVEIGLYRLAPRVLSYTASIGPSDKMLPTRLSEGAYKLEALPPSRNRALGQFSPSRNRRAKASNVTSPGEIAKMTFPAAPTHTPLRALSDVLRSSKRGCTPPFITSIGPDCVARSARIRCFRNARVSATAPLLRIYRRHRSASCENCHSRTWYLRAQARAPVPHRGPQA